MATRSTPTRTARRPPVVLVLALVTTTLLGASAPVPVLQPETAAACAAGSSDCGG